MEKVQIKKRWGVSLEPENNDSQTILTVPEEVVKYPVHVVTPFDHISFNDLTKEEKKEFVTWVKTVNGFLLLQPSTTLKFYIFHNSKTDSRKVLKAILVYYQKSGWIATINGDKQSGEGEKKKTTYGVGFKPNPKIKSIKQNTVSDDILKECEREVEELLRVESTSDKEEINKET